MGTITATASLDARYIVLAASGLPAGNLTLYRTPEGGREQQVGGAQLVAVDGTFNLDDWEAPQRTYLSYRGEVTDAAGTVLDTIPATACSGRVARPGDVLFGTLAASEGREVIVESQMEREIEVTADVAKVINRSDPVVVMDANQWWSGTLVLVTTTADDDEWMESLLLSGQVLGFTPYEPVYGYRETQFLVVTKVVGSRFVRRAAEQVRRWRLTVQTVERPQS